MPGLAWDYTEDIALAFGRKFPELDPTISVTPMGTNGLRNWKTSRRSEVVDGG